MLTVSGLLSVVYASTAYDGQVARLPPPPWTMITLPSP
jgi:hypothetical protein